uniref:Protein kinase domain-containing protein n=1 Tax=Rhizophagus irregularis (strain DAOM 181602 / DAOM 197198 / MUCL 43194) TaxID=747089 RepID=U9TK11_RHIID
MVIQKSSVYGGFGTIYKAIWLKNNGSKEVILKCHKNLNENLNEFLKNGIIIKVV